MRERCESGAGGVRELPCTDQHDPLFAGSWRVTLVLTVGFVRGLAEMLCDMKMWPCELLSDVMTKAVSALAQVSRHGRVTLA